MARSNSKYFSKVIEKLIEAKHKENIVVDQDFKERLRMNITARAAEMVKPENVDYKENMNDMVGGLMARWRYAFAIVPSALLLVLVAAHFMQMPVEMDSDVYVPVGGETGEMEKTGDTENAADTDNVSTMVIVTFNSGSGNVNTPATASVL